MTVSPALRDAWPLVKRSLRGWIDDNASSLGAALAFYTLLSLAPLAIIIIAVAGLFIGSAHAQDVLVAQLSQLMGEGSAHAIAEVVANTRNRSSGLIATMLGIAALLGGATTVFVELQQAPANDDVVERAQKIVKGEDPVLLRKKP